MLYFTVHTVYKIKKQFHQHLQILKEQTQTFKIQQDKKLLYKEQLNNNQR